jgi:hypothetical protein
MTCTETVTILPETMTGFDIHSRSRKKATARYIVFLFYLFCFCFAFLRLRLLDTGITLMFQTNHVFSLLLRTTTGPSSQEFSQGVSETFPRLSRIYNHPDFPEGLPRVPTRALKLTVHLCAGKLLQTKMKLQKEKTSGLGKHITLQDTRMAYISLSSLEYGREYTGSSTWDFFSLSILFPWRTFQL